MTDQQPTPNKREPVTQEQLYPLLRALSWITLIPVIFGVIVIIMSIFTLGGFWLLVLGAAAVLGFGATLLSLFWNLCCLALLGLSIFALVRKFEPRLTFIRYALQSGLFLAIGSGFVGAITQSPY